MGFAYQACSYVKITMMILNFYFVHTFSLPHLLEPQTNKQTNTSIFLTDFVKKIYPYQQICATGAQTNNVLLHLVNKTITQTIL